MTKMRVALGLGGELADTDLVFASQMGCSGIVHHVPALPGEGRWEASDLLALRRRVESFGLRLESIENTPWPFYEPAMLGAENAAQCINDYARTVRNIGEAGIPVLGFCWMPNIIEPRLFQTAYDTRGRAGSMVRSFEMGLVEDSVSHGRPYPAEEMWNNFERFMEVVLPAAESAGVRLALHPDDPPMPELGGIARIFRGNAGFRRAIETYDSPNFGLNFCLGTWSEMDEDAVENLRFFAERQKVVYLHFRDVKGKVPSFEECYLGEGNVNLAAAIRVLRDSGFEGFMENDHVPAMVEDSPFGHRSRALATGYILGLINGVTATA